jgi:hypothetical protein
MFTQWRPPADIGEGGSMISDAIVLLLALQIFHVLFLALHDWIPLGRLNNIKAARSENSLGALVAGTFISTTPFAVGLAASIYYLGRGYPAWLWIWLWASYALLFVGELQAWWIPYLFAAQPVRAARYEKMFGNTHAFLPQHNGITPNTLHVILHSATLATLVVLALLSWRMT